MALKPSTQAHATSCTLQSKFAIPLARIRRRSGGSGWLAIVSFRCIDAIVGVMSKQCKRPPDARVPVLCTERFMLIDARIH